MECKKIEDMMQLYVEDLCSKESEMWINEHVKTCPSCKKKLEHLQQEKRLEMQQEPEKKMDEKELEKELKPFKKLRRKLWVRCVLDVIAIIAVVTVLVSVGILAVTGWHKIENYTLKKQGEQLVSDLVEGEVDRFLSALNVESDLNEFVKGKKEFQQACRKDVEKFYKTELKGKKVKTKVTIEQTYYVEKTYQETDLCATIKTPETEFYMTFANGINGFSLIGFYEKEGKEDAKTENYLNKLNELSTASFYATRLIPEMKELDEKYQKEEKAPFVFTLGKTDTSEDSSWAEESWEKLRALMKAGMSIEKSGCAGLYYDTARDEICTTLMWTLKDTEGKVAYLEQEICIPNIKGTDVETVVISDGFSGKEVAQLKQIFH